MRIAFILSEFPVLSETFVLNQITGLVDRGHVIDILASSSGPNSKVHEDVKKYALLDRTFYWAPVPENKLKRGIKGVHIFTSNLHYCPISLIRSLNFFKYGRQAANLHLLYKVAPLCGRVDRDYDIVHCHFGPNGMLGARLRDIGAIKGKVVTTFHGYDISTYLMNNGRKVYDYLFKSGDLFLPISERWKERLIDIGCDKEKIIVHRMGIDPNRFKFRLRKSNDGSVRILTVARLVEKKGVEYGIRAVCKLLPAFPNVEYLIAGDGPLKNDLQRLVEKLGLGRKVKLLGWMSQGEIVDLMENAHIMLAPSVTSKEGDQEGIPVALMEALAMGLPVVSTYHSGIPELVKDGESGLLAPERDVDALAEKLRQLIENPSVWPEMGRAGRSFVEQHYNIDKLNDRLVDIFKKLASEGRRSN